MPRETNKNIAISRRDGLREEFWPGSFNWIWDTSTQKQKGFVTLPRLMPWITTLIRHVCKSGDPTPVYWEFWCRHMGQGLVEIRDEEECAFAAGYTSTRALRTWYEHVRTLADCHFIDFREVGLRKVGFVFLPSPLAVARWYYEQGKTPKGWWESFRSRAREVGAEVPSSIDPSIFSRKATIAQSLESQEFSKLFNWLSRRLRTTLKNHLLEPVIFTLTALRAVASRQIARLLCQCSSNGQRLAHTMVR